MIMLYLLMTDEQYVKNLACVEYNFKCKVHLDELLLY